nr:NADH dehydrogenase subunit 5 [Paduniella sp. LP-2022]
MLLCKYIIYFNFLIFFFFFFFIMGLEFLMFNFYVILEWEIVTLNSSNIVMLLLFDWLSLMFISLVMMISSMVIYYSKFYMSLEVFYIRFIFLVLLFVLSMVLMILSPNLISIMLGWDGLGFISYALIIYYQNVKSFNSGMLTILMNRIGDFMILLGIVWMLNYGSWNFMMFNDLMMIDFEMKLICFLIFMGAITKSAQIPFSIWLPAAMAAPTPVSALVHSSTLVTAGVYLMIRFMNLLINSYVLNILFILSLLTMFMAGFAANYEFDLKKIIALSTLSQLGLMMSILSLNFKLLCFFHLLTHALFKSMLFMCAGIMIHMMNNNQDIRLMGGLVMLSPMLSMIFNIGNMALCGLPFMSGFYSKDLMLEMLLFMKFNLIFFFFFFFSIGLTISYTFRLMYFSIFSYLNYYVLFMISDDWKMIYSMMILMLFSLISGSMLNWLIFFYFEFIYLSSFFKSLIMIFMFIGVLIGMYLYKLKVKFMNFNNLVFIYYMNNMFFMLNLLTYSLSYMFILISKKFSINLDLGWFEKLGSQGIYKEVIKLSMLNQFIQLNYLKVFMAMIMILMFYFIF